MRDTSDNDHSSGEQPDNPLVRLFDEDERPAEVIVETSERVDASEFVAGLDALADAAHSIDRIQRDLEAIRSVGLRDNDVRDLIYGRNSGLAKRDIEAVLGGISDVQHGRGDLLVKLLADVSALSQTDTREVLDELRDLRDHYGDTEGSA
jgi:uncharacterized membrane protein YdfJ with MMPL/SSD domain